MLEKGGDGEEDEILGISLSKIDQRRFVQALLQFEGQRPDLLQANVCNELQDLLQQKEGDLTFEESRIAEKLMRMVEQIIHRTPLYESNQGEQNAKQIIDYINRELARPFERLFEHVQFIQPSTKAANEVIAGK